MRRIQVALVLGFVVAACGGEEPPVKAPEPPSPATATPPPPPPTETAKAETPPPPKPTMAEMQEKTLKGALEAFNAHDAKKFASFYAENGVVKVAGMPDATGREAIADVMQGFFNAFSNLKIAPAHVFMKNDVVVEVWGATGTHSGEWMGVKASEKPVGIMGASVFWFNQDGQVKEEHVYMDAGTLMGQIGASKNKVRAPVALPASPNVVSAKGSPEEDKNVELAKKSLGFMEAKKEKEWLDTMADAVEWDDMTAPGPSKGKEDVKKYLQMLSAGLPDAKFNLSSAWGVGDYVIAEGTLTGTHKGTFMGIPATKKSLNMNGLEILLVKDEKIQKGWRFGNGAQMMMQLGLMKEPGAAKPADTKGGAAAKPADTKPAAPAKPAGTKPAAPAKPADTKTPAKK